LQGYHFYFTASFFFNNPEWLEPGMAQATDYKKRYMRL
jgi:hypothetical protein